MIADLPVWLTLSFLFVLGSVVGSFLNVCIYRLAKTHLLPNHNTLWPQLKSLAWPPSSCPGCKNRIPGIDNVPILGWLKLRGRCRFCRMRISSRYPLIEFANGLLWVLVYCMEMPTDVRRGIIDGSLYVAKMGPQMLDVWSAPAWLHWRYFYHMVLIEALVVATFIDFDTMEIPDGATLPAMAVGLLGGWGLGQVFVVPVWFQSAGDLHIFKSVAPAWMQWLMDMPDLPAWISLRPHWHGLAVSLAGLLMGGGVVWAVRIVGGWALKREAMGFGDVILMAMIGSFLGWQATLVVFFLAPFCAIGVALISLIFRRNREIPYGPYLSFAALLLILKWQAIWPSAEPVFQLGVAVPLLVVIMMVLLAGCLLVVQLGKRMLGIPLYPEEPVKDEWRSADQLAYAAGENVDDQQGRWQAERWQGVDAGRGLNFENQWRQPPAGW